MWYQIISAFCLADQDDGPGGMGKYLPVILFIVYIVSSLIKGKQTKKPPETPAPKQKPSQPAPPAYMRKLPPTHPARQSQVPPNQPSTRPSTPPPTRLPAQTGTSEPAIKRPIPVPRPVSQTSKPAPTVSSPQPMGSPRPPIQQTAKPIPRSGAMPPRPIPIPVVAQQPVIMPPKVHPSGTAEEKKTQVLEKRSQVVSTGAIPLAFNQKDELARAVLYAEILGTPVGLRPMGSYDY